LKEEQLESYRPKKPEKSSKYQIEDHKFLVEKEQTRQLFETFRTQVLALDPCVTEEFLKYYVAYKAETNFVDLVPKASFIRLTLNLDFPELQDPYGKARDLTNIHKWGNGNVEVTIREADEIPYAIGLVRQALEKQLGGVEIDA
jgi:predicted transport protein